MSKPGVVAPQCHSGMKSWLMPHTLPLDLHSACFHFVSKGLLFLCSLLFAFVESVSIKSRVYV